MIGTRIGQYRVLELLGEGGMGRVLLVEHVVMGTRHALKVLHDELSRNEQIVQRFLNEARSAGAIGHRNVVEITHVDQMEGGGAWYLVMKYLEGRTLTSFLASAGGRIEQRLIVHVLGEALNGLQAAHDRRIVHRDLKPDNLYLTSVKEDPFRTIILDFGVAQLGHDGRAITRTGALVGTPQYMAPEQLRAAHIDHRADVWAMGAIAYEMITGRLPYQYDDAERNALTGPEIFHRMMTRPVVDPRQYNPAITEAFARATLSALALDPAARPHSARTFARTLAEATPGSSGAPSGIEILRRYADELLDGDALHPRAPSIASGDRPAVAPSGPRLSTLGAAASQSQPAASPVGRSRRRRSVLALALGVAVAIGIGAVVLLGYRGGSSTAPAIQASALPGDAASGPMTTHPDAHAATTMPDAATFSATLAASAAPPADARTLASAARDAGVPEAPQAAVSGAERSSSQTSRADTSPAAPKPSPQVPASGRNEGPTGEPRPAPQLPVSGRNARSTDEAQHPGTHGSTVKSTAPGAMRAEPAATGKLSVVVLPWAEVWVDGRAQGQTPLTLKLSVGQHRVRLKNDAREKTVMVTVTAGKMTSIDESW